MSTINLLFKKQYDINESIKVRIPTVGEVVDNEDDYYNIVYSITGMPIDFMVQLDDVGIDYTQITAFDLFMILFEGIKEKDTSLIFGDLDLSKFEPTIDTESKKVFLYDRENDIIIDNFVHNKIACVLRKIHHLKKNIRKPGNEETKKYMLERARQKMKRNKNRSQESQLEPLIVALVNTEQFKYDYEGTRELSIYQFNESVAQIIHKDNYENLMHGIYAGTVNAKEIKQSELNWLTHE